MPRYLSVALTEDAVRLRIKTETRRLGWAWLQPGERLTLVRKSMGRSHRLPDGTRHVEPIHRLGEVIVTDVRREPLHLITDAAVEREGFGRWADGATFSDGYDWWPDDYQGDAREDPGEAARRFVEFFTAAMRCPPDAEVTVISWEYAK